jgi:fluoroacetyl-CoA thioesterase
MLWSSTIFVALLAGAPWPMPSAPDAGKPSDRPAYARSPSAGISRDFGARPALPEVSRIGADAEAAQTVRLASRRDCKSSFVKSQGLYLIALGEAAQMKPSLVPGLSAINRIAVEKAAIGFMGEEDDLVYIAPFLVAAIETSCRNVILAHADANEDNVGVEVAIKHLAQTLPGIEVEIAVEIMAIRGRRVMFVVTVKDKLDTVIFGTHTRFVVDKAKTVERLKAKAEKLAARQA